MSRNVRMLLVAVVTLAAVVTLVAARPLAAQDRAHETTVSAIERGEAAADVYLQGAALEQLETGAFVFSDGTGVIDIRLGEGAGEEELPLFKLISVEGTLDEDGVAVSTWELVPIFTPAVIVEEPQVIDAFWNWIIAFDSQAPTE